jgi:type IV pilus assembly protein PilA
MKRDFQAKFLMHLNGKKKADEGFTLIELLVVIIIIGILAAIALPSLLGQANKARQAEAKNNIGAINRAQQGFFLEAQNFTTSLSALGIGVTAQTENYDYNINIKGEDLTKTPKVAGTANNLARARSTTLKNYVGMVGTIEGNKDTGEVLTIGLVCEPKFPSGKIAVAKDANYDVKSTDANKDDCEESIGSADWKNLGG